MNKFVTYFDFLGFKNFILNNDSEYIRRRINHILRDIELSIGQGVTTKTTYGFIANIQNSRINCLNISDTVIFWTNDDSYDSFAELLKISFDFNWRVTCYHFPVRGAIVFGDIDVITGYQENYNGGTYNVNSIYGKGLVNAHLKAENLNLASCVIDNSVVEKIKEFGVVEEIFGDYAMAHIVPYKNGELDEPEYLLKFYINKTINEEAFKNRAKGIEEAFTNDNKGMNARSEILLENTIKFLKLQKE
jgi:hypothetical protein